MATHPQAGNTASRSVPIGLAKCIVVVAHRVRRPALLVGGPGLGKSELLTQVCRELGIECRIIDLSLCEPSDLVGLPRFDQDCTVFAPPASLPRDGEGLLVFEELNRAERYIQGPVLQLLTARRLNDYTLPPGWTCVAAINPDDGKNQVRPLDPAMMSRFLVVPVRADRGEWVRWARENGVHPAVLHVVDTDSSSFDEVSPRSWTYASDLLHALTPEERGRRELAHETLAGVLPEPWVVTLLESQARVHGGDLVAVDVLHRCATDEGVRQRLDALRDEGRTDVLRALAKDVEDLLASPVELQRLRLQRGVSLKDFEALLAHLPGDLRQPLQDALATNAAAPQLLEVDFATVLGRGYEQRRIDWQLCEWQRIELLNHRARLFVAGLCEHLRQANLAAVRRANAGRRVIGRILEDLQPPFRQPLLDCLERLLIEPILVDRRL